MTDITLLVIVMTPFIVAIVLGAILGTAEELLDQWRKP